MAGGPSHVDTFDYKPELFAKDGKQIDFVGVRIQIPLEKQANGL